MQLKSLMIIFAMFMAAVLVAQSNNAQVDELCYFKEKKMNDALTELRAKTGINFIYQNDLVEKIKLDGVIKRSSVEKDLSKMFLVAGLDIKEFGSNSIVIFPKKKKQVKPEEHIEAYLLKEPVKEKVDSMLTFQDAELASKMELDYPANAIKNKEHGDVNIKILISSRGNVCASELQESSGYSILDSVAIAYTKKLKFIPASVNGKPRSSWVKMIFKYFLTEK